MSIVKISWYECSDICNFYNQSTNYQNLSHYISLNMSQVWLITGASAGFGLVLTEVVLKHGHQVIAATRNPSKAAQENPQIESLGGKWVKLDVTSPSAVKDVDAAIKSFGKGKIDVLVNNAAFFMSGGIEDVK